MRDQNQAFKASESIGDDDTADALLSSKRYSCLCFPCFQTHQSAAADEPSWWERVKATKFDGEEHWWSGGLRSLKKLREWSEIIAGPRWKTFIRRFNRNRTGGVKLGKFQYDPISYALNFDEGLGHNGNIGDFEDDEYKNGFQNFGGRFASGSVTVKSAVDGTG